MMKIIRRPYGEEDKRREKEDLPETRCKSQTSSK